MANLIESLKQRGVVLAETTRDRGVDALGKIRNGTLDWHRTLETRRAELKNGHEPRWFELDGLQMFVIDRVDRVLSTFGQRVRAEIERLQHLELSPATPVAPKKLKAKLEKKGKAKAKKTRPAAKAKRSNGKATRRFVMPIAGYDELTAKEILAELGRLTPSQAGKIRAHEAGHKKRKTVLAALDARISA